MVNIQVLCNGSQRRRRNGWARTGGTANSNGPLLHALPVSDNDNDNDNTNDNTNNYIDNDNANDEDIDNDINNENENNNDNDNVGGIMGW